VSNPLEEDGSIVWLAYRSLYPKTGDMLVKKEKKNGVMCPLELPLFHQQHTVKFSLDQFSEK
jgi:hypothetical protein